jgi:hypothetical protein
VFVSQQGIALKAPVYLIVLPLLGFMLAACQPPATNEYPTRTSTITAALQPSASTEDQWQELLEHTPVPWITPLPPEEATILDSTYVKIDPRLATPFPCKRCLDYAIEGGLVEIPTQPGRIPHLLHYE